MWEAAAHSLAILQQMPSPGRWCLPLSPVPLLDHFFFLDVLKEAKCLGGPGLGWFGSRMQFRTAHEAAKSAWTHSPAL